MTAFPHYTWNKEKGGRKKDPINLVFTNTSLKKIQTDLKKSGWTSAKGILQIASNQYTPDSPPRKRQDAQPVKGPLWDRYHVRIWHHKGKSFVGSGHNEIISLWFAHVVGSHEAAKEEIEDDLNNSSWIIKKDKHNLNNQTRKKFSNGKATEFEENISK